MDIVEFVQKFFILIIPGLIGSIFLNYLNIRKERHYYFEILYMFAFSFISFLITDVILAFMTLVFPRIAWRSIDIVQYINSQGVSIPLENLIISIIIAIIIACLITKANFENWGFKLSNKLKITRRIDNEPIWDHVFDNNSIIVIRDMVTKNTYFGRACKFSDNSDNREIYLENVYVYDENSEFLYHAVSLYISRAHNEFTIETHENTINEEA